MYAMWERGGHTAAHSGIVKEGGKGVKGAGKGVGATGGLWLRGCKEGNAVVLFFKPPQTLVKRKGVGWGSGERVCMQQENSRRR